MATESQIIANRTNAQKSTGPRTPEGKAAVSQNALKHGLTAQQTVISSESQADFELHREQILSELAPVTAMESILAERIVSLSWRLKRAELIQNQSINALNADYIKYFSTKSSYSQDDSDASSPDLTLGRMAIRDFSNSRVLDRLLMYERRIEQSLFKTLLEFQKLRLLRNSNPHPQDTPALRSLGEGGDCDSPITNGDEPIADLQSKTADKTLGALERFRRSVVQNKPNLPNNETIVTSIKTKNYENKSSSESPQNKPDSNPKQTRSDLSATAPVLRSICEEGLTKTEARRAK